MTPEAYSKYEEYERNMPARREVNNLQQYLQKQNATIDPSYESIITSGIREAEAYVDISWNGPYDSGSGVKVGKGPVLADLEGQIAQLASATQMVTQNLAGKVPQEYVNYITGYYSQRMQEIAKVIENIKIPPPLPPALKSIPGQPYE
jgi:hypothetical protein